MSAVSNQMVFIDGENLVMRYQDMVTNGKNPKKDVLHKKDIYVWHESLIDPSSIRNIVRITYYTYTTGDPNQVHQVKKEIIQIEYSYITGKTGGIGTRGAVSNTINTGNVVPVVFWKSSKQAKAKGVDIQMTIDMLNSSRMNHVDLLILISGDGDYIPVIQEVMRRGKLVFIQALSSGLNPELEVVGDGFECIDSYFFENP